MGSSGRGWGCSQVHAWQGRAAWIRDAGCSSYMKTTRKQGLEGKDGGAGRKRMSDSGVRKLQRWPWRRRGVVHGGDGQDGHDGGAMGDAQATWDEAVGNEQGCRGSYLLWALAAGWEMSH